MAKTAVVLFNLGGPDKPEAVQPLLTNLFSDPAILALPAPFRGWLARLIAKRRAAVAQKIYAELGGGSPILAETEKQAKALEAELGEDVRVFITMRYWHPMSDATAEAVKVYAPDAIVLLPLYPQYSTTTTASSLADWHRAARRAGLDVPTSATCCYPTEAGFIDALTTLTRAGVEQVRRASKATPRILFSAHGLPERIVARGDPYPGQVERTAAAIRSGLGDVESVVCYQSRVGPLKWIGPSTESEIARAGHDGRAVVVVPIAFVSEHSETLVELDIEYRKRAQAHNVPVYVRVPTVGTEPAFIAGLARLVRAAHGHAAMIVAGDGKRICPGLSRACPLPMATGSA